MSVPQFAAVVYIAAMISAGCFVKSLPDPFSYGREERLDELISKSERLTELANLCADLGSVQGFKLLRRSLAKDGSELYFYFNSDKPFSAASELFSKYFYQMGWERLKESRTARMEYYGARDLKVDIQYGGIGDAEYGITCAKTKASN